MSDQTGIRVRDALIDQADVVDGLASARDALEIMKTAGRDALIIDKRNASDEYGLLHISQIASEVFSRNRNPDRVSVYELMEKPAINLRADMQARYAIRLMCRLGAEKAIVVDNEKMLGYVSLRDLSLAIFSEQS